MANEWFKELETKKKTLAQQIANEGKEKIKEAFEEFFKANPEIKLIYWTQYTPHFNDGDSCVFSMNEPVFSLLSNEEIDEAELDLSELEYEKDESGRPYTINGIRPPTPEERISTKSWNISDVKEYDSNPRLHDNVREFRGDVFSEGVFLMCFGDHVCVKTIYKDGKVNFDVDEYEHD